MNIEDIETMKELVRLEVIDISNDTELEALEKILSDLHAISSKDEYINSLVLKISNVDDLREVINMIKFEADEWQL